MERPFLFRTQAFILFFYTIRYCLLIRVGRRAASPTIVG